MYEVKIKLYGYSELENQTAIQLAFSSHSEHLTRVLNQEVSYGMVMDSILTNVFLYYANGQIAPTVYEKNGEHSLYCGGELVSVRSIDNV